uniref:Uncharacterized protein n=1 Tax=Panagrolaimus sp. ES5 TaxID=591445 RepID=A0AC34FH13_9BILA
MYLQKKLFIDACFFGRDKNENSDDQLDKLIEILKTKNHWQNPLIDALIRNGHGSVAEELMKISSNRTQKVA